MYHYASTSIIRKAIFSLSLARVIREWTITRTRTISVLIIYVMRRYQRHEMVDGEIQGKPHGFDSHLNHVHSNELRFIH